VILPSITEDQNGITINDHKVAQQRLGYIIDEPLECGKGFGQAKMDHHPFIEPKSSFKSCFPSVGSIHVHLIIARCEIRICKIICPFVFIKKVFDRRERITIF
jgi:hypothetical protein